MNSPRTLFTTDLANMTFVKDLASECGIQLIARVCLRDFQQITYVVRNYECDGPENTDWTSLDNAVDAYNQAVRAAWRQKETIL